jgi:CRP/FNR family transcriptional regulator
MARVGRLTEGRSDNVTLPPVYRPAPFSDVCHYFGIDLGSERVEENRCAYLVAVAGTQVHQRGQRLENVYVVASGIAKSVYQEHGKEFITGFSFPGELLGLDGVDGLRYQSTVTALTDLLLLSIPYEVLLLYCRRYPAFDQALVRLFAGQMADIIGFTEVMARAKAEVRVAYFLRGLARRLGTTEKPLTEFDVGISRRDIARYLGIAYETLSRILRDFCTMGVIELSRSKLMITDYSVLQRMCDGYTDRLHPH